MNDKLLDSLKRVNNAYARRHGFKPPHSDLLHDALADEIAAMDLADAEIMVQEIMKGREEL